MVKLNGPMLSSAAAGSFADVLTFAKNNNRPSARKHAKPKDPQTGPQLGIRSLVKFLAQKWRLLPPAEQATWTALAVEQNIAPYHHWIKYNMRRWHHEKAPSQGWPATEAPPSPNQGGFVAYSKWHGVVIIIGTRPPPEPWGFFIHLSQTNGFVPSNSNLVRVIAHKTGSFDVLSFYDLEPGVWYYRQHPFSANGRWGLWGGQRTFTVLG